MGLEDLSGLAGGGLTGGMGGVGEAGKSSATATTGPIDTTTNMRLAGSSGGTRSTVFNVSFPGAYVPGSDAVNSPNAGGTPWLIIGGIGIAILLFVVVLFKR